MSLQTKTIIAQEWKKPIKVVTKKFTNHHENWHKGDTYQFAKGLNETDARYWQFKTIIEKQKQDYFIYEEVIRNNDKPFFIVRLHDNEKRKIYESIAYFEKNEVVQQIRYLHYDEFCKELENNEGLLKAESKNTTIIKTSLLTFVKTIEAQKQKNIEKEIKEEYWNAKRIIWKICYVLVFIIAWCSTSIIANLLIVPEIIGVVSPAVMTWLPYTVAGLVAGLVVELLNKCSKMIEKKLSSKGKDEQQIALERKLREQENRLKIEYWQDLFLYLPPNAKQERILNAFQQINQFNKTKSFKSLKKELIRMFKENKKVLKKIYFLKFYPEKIRKWNENWKENIEFSKFLKPQDIKEMKAFFSEKEKNKSPVPPGFYYKPEETWEKFQEWKNKSNQFEKEAIQTKLNGIILEKDVREKSPVTTMKNIVL